jgi:hypothetical protein
VLGGAVREIAKPLALPAQALVADQPRLGRDLDHQVAAGNHLAGQHVSAADLVAGEELGRLPFHFPFAHDHPALAANPLASADGPHVDVRRARGLEDGPALFDRRLLSFGEEADAVARHDQTGFRVDG